MELLILFNVIANVSFSFSWFGTLARQCIGRREIPTLGDRSSHTKHTYLIYCGNLPNDRKITYIANDIIQLYCAVRVFFFSKYLSSIFRASRWVCKGTRASFSNYIARLDSILIEHDKR